ncbi:MAG: DivIVA domain-containing protein [Clostridia bacterium]|nr:DivIVA domain-containing protein [Clostridia bacterium]
MITPLEIENKKFSKKTLNGYNAEEVDDFLDDLVKDYEILYRQATEGQDQLEELNTKLEHYSKIESTLQNTLLMAQAAADELKNAAQKQAEQIIKEAETRARESTLGIQQEISMKQKELEELEKKFDVYKAKMESLLISQLELIKEVNKDD